MSIVTNVLFKGVEYNPHHNNYCKAFSKYEDAIEWAERNAAMKGLTIKSEMGFCEGQAKDVLHSVNDLRCEDSQGNSYYYVFYIQEIE